MKFLMKRFEINYFIFLIICDYIFAKLRSFFSIKTNLIDFSEEIIDCEEVNLFLRNYDSPANDKFKELTLNKLDIALKYPNQFGIYNLSELSINKFKNKKIDDKELKIIRNKIYNIIWKNREKNLLTNNHLLNNYRALIYLSLDRSQRELNRLIKLIIIHHENIFNLDGTSKEGSTSYSFLVTFWICDLVQYLENKKFSPKFFLNLLRRKMFNSLKVCHLLLKCTADNKFCIGDITPDIPSIELCNLIKYFIKKYDVKEEISFSSNSSIHYQTKSNNHVTLSKRGNHKSNVIQDHSHHDISSITWTYKDIPILVDPGCKSYDKRFEDHNQILFENHNTIFPDKKILSKEFPTLNKNKLSKSLSYFDEYLDFSEDLIIYILKGRFFKIRRAVNINKSRFICIKDEITKYVPLNFVFFNWNIHPRFPKKDLIIRNSDSECLLIKNKYCFSDDYSVVKKGVKIFGKSNFYSRIVKFEHVFEYCNGSLRYNFKRI